MTPWTGAIPFFSVTELACKGTGAVRLDPRFAAALPFLRVSWGRPLAPNSVCRTPAHNARVGGHPRSLHLTENPAHPGAAGTMAADLAWRDWPVADQLALARLAWRQGWAVGLHNGFVHVDRRADLGMARAVFLYGEWAGLFGPDDVMQPVAQAA